jgi:hypothetical protein
LTNFGPHQNLLNIEHSKVLRSSLLLVGRISFRSTAQHPYRIVGSCCHHRPGGGFPLPYSQSSDGQQLTPRNNTRNSVATSRVCLTLPFPSVSAHCHEIRLTSSITFHYSLFVTPNSDTAPYARNDAESSSFLSAHWSTAPTRSHCHQSTTRLPHPKPT